MRKAATACAAAVMVMVAACASNTTDAVGSLADPLPSTAPSITADTLQMRGQLVEQSEQAFDDPDHLIGQARRAVYKSVSGLDGTVRDVSGAFFLPAGSPPPGGWRVISIGHGTTGIGTDCGPSRDSDLLGFRSMVDSYLREGYAVAMTDYEGLGGTGSHPYLEPRTAGFNVVDAVRALRNLFPNVSTYWAGLGNSQGGQAVWAANELAGQYATGLNLVGSVALSPAANITAIADLGRAGGLSSEQRDLLPLIAEGVARYDPRLVEDGVAPRLTAEQQTQAFSCDSDAGGRRDELVPPTSIHLDDERTVAVFRTALRRIALPQQPLAAPMLVVNGLDDRTIPAEWVRTAVGQACALGDHIDHVEVTGAGHGDLGAQAYDIASQWLRDRFAGSPAPSNCGDAARVVPVG